MSLKKIIASFIWAIAVSQLAIAQSSYEYNSDMASVYSRYGIGTLSSRTNGFNTSMAGAGLALSSGSRINSTNPASYASVDSVTFLLDAGMSLDRNSLSYNGSTCNSYASRLKYVNFGFQIIRGMGLSFGYMPMSSIGYDYTTSKHVGYNPNTGQEIRTSSSYFGTGGIHQVYLGLGYSPVKNLAIGFNAGYLWGEYSHTMTQDFTDGGTVSSSYVSQVTFYNASLSSYNIEFGLLYNIDLTKKDRLSLGATTTIGHNLNNDANFLRYTTGGDSTSVTLPKAFELPMAYNVGIAYQKGTQLKIAADFGLEKWAGCSMPIYDKTYTISHNEYLDRTSYKLGAEFCPSHLSRHYINRICYRIGAYYNSPYVKVNDADGPSEYGVTAGFALPITNRYNSKSVINIGFRWNHVKPSVSTMMSENQLCVTLGITFNEQWFMKWKIQ